jgi:branched-chain amino acid transport system ATP-binding protein
MKAALRTEGLSKQWGSFKANNDLNIALPLGARHALIGPNGAGKTTFINLLTGALAPTSGKVYLNGENVTHLSQHQRVKRGMTRTFQINTLFPGLTVLESVVLTVCERRGIAGRWMSTVAKQRDAVAWVAAPAAGSRCAHPQSALRQAAPGRNCTGAGDQAENPAAR